jgi:hypothetical protein
MNLYRIEIRDANEKFDDVLARAIDPRQAAEIARDVIELEQKIQAPEWHFTVYKITEPETGSGHVYEAAIQNPRSYNMRGRNAKN